MVMMIMMMMMMIMIYDSDDVTSRHLRIDMN